MLQCNVVSHLIGWAPIQYIFLHHRAFSHPSALAKEQLFTTTNSKQIYKSKQTIFVRVNTYQMGWAMEVWLSRYLVLLSNDSKRLPHLHNLTHYIINSCVKHLPFQPFRAEFIVEKNRYITYPFLTLSAGNWDNYNDVTMGVMASQITNVSIVYLSVSSADQRKHQMSASLAFVRGIHRSPVNSPHKGPVTRKMFPFDDVITRSHAGQCCGCWCTGDARIR